MRWRQGRRSINVENRRGFPVKTAGGGGLLFLGLLVFLAGGDPTALLMEGISRGMQPPYQSQLTPEQEQEQSDFVSVVLAATEDTWRTIFAEEGQAYEDPRLVLFTGSVDSACGQGQAAMGPFYCPIDRMVYLDLNFFHDLQYRHEAPGDFARAYVIAHEIGHHVQALTGVLQKVHGPGANSRAEANRMSVLTELQADCYAGLWAHHAGRQNILEPGDIGEALKAASQIGDDKLQEQAYGRVMPDSFTHGSAAQRYEWFRRGYEQGHLQDCDTFAAQL
jgi:uncharacterized protein